MFYIDIWNLPPTITPHWLSVLQKGMILETHILEAFIQAGTAKKPKSPF